MNRRLLIKSCIGGVIGGSAGLYALAKMTSVSAGDDMVAYSPEVYDEAIASGKPFMLDFYASW